MVIGGLPISDHVELLSLTEGISVPDCYQTMSPLPDGGGRLAARGLVYPGKLFAIVI